MNWEGCEEYMIDDEATHIFAILDPTKPVMKLLIRRFVVLEWHLDRRESETANKWRAWRADNFREKERLEEWKIEHKNLGALMDAYNAEVERKVKRQLQRRKLPLEQQRRLRDKSECLPIGSPVCKSDCDPMDCMEEKDAASVIAYEESERNRPRRNSKGNAPEYMWY